MSTQGNKTHTLKERAVFTLLLLGVVRFFYSVPTPGINPEYFKAAAGANALFGFMNIFSGNGLANMTVMAFNVTPYITASIIIQLLGNVFPKLHELQTGMQAERKQVERWTVILGISLAFIQGLGMALGFGKRGLFLKNSLWMYLAAAAIWASGTAAASLVGKLIQDKCRFNGVSLILLLNIVSSYPGDFTELYHAFMEKKPVWIMILAAAVIAVAVFAMFCLVYVIQESKKTIKVQYSGKASSANAIAKTSGELPLKMCPGGVVPVIYTSTILSLPAMIAAFATGKDYYWTRFLSSAAWFNPKDMLPTVGVILYIFMVVGFSFFSAYTTLDPFEAAENMKKSGGMIPGVRPGRPTETYIRKKMRGIVSVGAAALLTVSLVPIVIGGIFGLSRLSFFGTSVIITVGVLVELKEVIRTEMSSKRYVIRETKEKKKQGGLF